MHREIMGLANGDPMQVDHIDPTQTLDNRRCNLRLATFTENQRNKRRQRNNTSGIKGVSRNKSGRFQVTIHVGGKNKYLGRYDSVAEAGRVYAEAAAKYYGEFARLC
jgi:hypothetical protein